jgi:hypothetical protein
VSVRRSWLIGGGIGLGLIAAGLVAATWPPPGPVPVDLTTDGVAVAAEEPEVQASGTGDTAGSARVPRGAGGPLGPDDARVPAGDPAGPGDADDAVDEVRAGVLRVRLPRGLDQELVDTIEALPEVLAVTVSRSDTVGLIGSRTADGTVRDELRDGFRIPVAVSAIDPDATAATLAAEGADEALRTTVAAIEPGQALLTVTGARARGLDIGGRIDLDGVRDLVVIGLVPDDDAGRTEILVHRDHAESLGMRAGRSVTVRHEAPTGAATEQLVSVIEALAPGDGDIRITDVVARARERAEADAPAAGSSPLVLGLPELKATFGEFAYRPRSGVREIDIDPSFVADDIVSARVPLLGNVRCHRAIIDDVAAALGELVDAGLGSWVDPAQYGGCFHARRIGTDRDRLSSHSWGAAIDINVDLSLPGLGPVPPDEMIEIFARHGFRWGGDFTTPDHHHWEWVGDRATERREG